MIVLRVVFGIQLGVDEVDGELATRDPTRRVDVLPRGLGTVDDSLEHAGRDRVVDVGDHRDVDGRRGDADLGGPGCRVADVGAGRRHRHGCECEHRDERE